MFPKFLFIEAFLYLYEVKVQNELPQQQQKTVKLLIRVRILNHRWDNYHSSMYNTTLSNFCLPL